MHINNVYTKKTTLLLKNKIIVLNVQLFLMPDFEHTSHGL